MKVKFSVPRNLHFIVASVASVAFGVARRRSIDIEKLLNAQRPPLALHSGGDALAADPFVEARCLPASAANSGAGEVEAALAAVAHDELVVVHGGGGRLGAGGAGRGATAREGGGATRRRSWVVMVCADDVDGDGVR